MRLREPVRCPYEIYEVIETTDHNGSMHLRFPIMHAPPHPTAHSASQLSSQHESAHHNTPTRITLHRNLKIAASIRS